MYFLSVSKRPRVSWGVLGCPGVIRLTASRKVLGPIMSIVALYKTMYTCVKEGSLYR